VARSVFVDSRPAHRGSGTVPETQSKQPAGKMGSGPIEAAGSKPCCQGSAYTPALRARIMASPDTFCRPIRPETGAAKETPIAPPLGGHRFARTGRHHRRVRRGSPPLGCHHPNPTGNPLSTALNPASSSHRGRSSMASPRLHRASCRCRHCAATCRDASGLVHRTDRSAPDGPAIIYADPAASTVKTLGIGGAEQMTLTIHRPDSDW